MPSSSPPRSSSSRTSQRSNHSSRHSSRHSSPHRSSSRRRSASPPRRGSDSAGPPPRSSSISSNGADSGRSRHQSRDLSPTLSELEYEERRHRSYAEGTTRKKAATNPLSRPARHFGRTIEMWRRFETILSDGYTCQEPEPYTACDPEAIPYIKLYKSLVKLIPSIPTLIEKEGITSIASMLETTRSNARGEDVKRIKDNLQSLRAFTPAVVPNDKNTRGFGHPEIGRLLVKSTDMDKWDEDPDYRQGLINGTTSVEPHDYPLFLFKDDRASTTDLLEGFLRNDLLVRAFRAIFLGLSAVNAKAPSACATKKGNAQLNNMHEVTIPSISYIATIVYFALSSQTNFTAGGDHELFDYNAFYRAIIDIMEYPASEARRVALLAWWKQRVFPNKHGATPSAIQGSVHAQMMEQLLREAAD